MNEEVKETVINETEKEMMNSLRDGSKRIILMCAKTLDCEHSRETIVRRLMHDAALWNEVWGSAREKLNFWEDYIESQRGTDYVSHLKSLEN